MFELAQLVLSAERPWWDRAMTSPLKVREESCLQTQVWLLRHKIFFLAAGALALLIVGRGGW